MSKILEMLHLCIFQTLYLRDNLKNRIIQSENKNIMDKKISPEANQSLVEKFFLSFLFLLIIISVAITFWKIIIQKDYIIEAQTDCDPYSQRCFIWECDPASVVEGEKCVGDPEEDIWYYNIVRRNASRIPFCDPSDESCTALVCDEGEPECEQIFCTEKNKTEQEAECNDPEQYTLDNPIEEELTEEDDTSESEGEEVVNESERNAEECAPNDSECLDKTEIE